MCGILGEFSITAKPTEKEEFKKLLNLSVVRGQITKAIIQIEKIYNLDLTIIHPRSI